MEHEKNEPRRRPPERNSRAAQAAQQRRDQRREQAHLEELRQKQRKRARHRTRRRFLLPTEIPCLYTILYYNNRSVNLRLMLSRFFTYSPIPTPQKQHFDEIRSIKKAACYSQATHRQLLLLVYSHQLT